MIKQKTAGDCGVAALANAITMHYNTNEPSPRLFEIEYEAIERKLGRNSGITIQEVCAVIFDNGYLPVYVPFLGFHRESGVHGTAYQEAGEVLTRGQTAILQVKTASGLLHFVYFDGKVIHDPSVSVEGVKCVDDYTLVDAVLIFDKSIKYYRGGLIGIKPENIGNIAIVKPGEEVLTSAVKDKPSRTVVMNNIIDAQSFRDVLESEDLVKTILKRLLRQS